MQHTYALQNSLHFKLQKKLFSNENWGSDPPYAIFSAVAELLTWFDKKTAEIQLDSSK